MMCFGAFLLCYFNCLMLFSEIHKYGDFYRFSDVRPPFTYAALIRQVRSCLDECYYYIELIITRRWPGPL